MLRIGFALVSMALLLGVTASAQDKAAGNPTVTWWGQSFFIVKSAKGTQVAFAPHALMEYGRLTGLKADVVCVSHTHTDHNATFVFENAKDKGFKVIDGLSGMGLRTTFNHIDETIKGIHIRSVPSYHDDREGLIRGKNTIFCVEMDGWRICHLGDLGQEPTPTQLKKIGPVDVLMIPVGGIYTLNGSEAKKAVEQIRPKEYIFPMHYGTKAFNDVLPVDEFLDEQDRSKIAVSDDNKVVLNRDKDRPRPLIVQLNYARRESDRTPPSPQRKQGRGGATCHANSREPLALACAAGLGPLTSPVSTRSRRTSDSAPRTAASRAGPSRGRGSRAAPRRACRSP